MAVAASDYGLLFLFSSFLSRFRFINIFLILFKNGY